MIQRIDKGINILIILCFLPILVYGCYCLWDNNRINQQADASLYETYRPSAKEYTSFAELCKKNPDVFGWITVKGTHIDYPLVQGEDNSKYVNTNVWGEFSLSGSIFLDFRNQKDFTDMNHIIYGHHMAKEAMFGELENYAQKSYFNNHNKGEIYYGDKWHQIEFFAFVKADAYDSVLYDTTLQSMEDVPFYLDYVREHAVNFRELSFQEEEKFVILSTCTSDSTNGRHLLIGRLKEEAENKQGEPKYENKK